MAFGYKRIFCADEQEAVEKLKDFLINDIGWDLEEDISDTSSDRDVTLSSDGEELVLNQHTRYIRLRGTSEEIRLFTYETYTDSSINTGEVSNTYGSVDIGQENFIIMAVADKERLTFQLNDPGGSRRYGYVGRIDSYYRVDQLKYPNLVKGGSFGWFSTSDRNMWMIAADSTVQNYYTVNIVGETEGIKQAAISARSQGQFAFKVPIGHLEGNSNDEILGEPRGLYWVPKLGVSSGQFIAIGEQLYVIFKTSDSGAEAFANGPISDGLVLPSNILE